MYQQRRNVITWYQSGLVSLRTKIWIPCYIRQIPENKVWYKYIIHFLGTSAFLLGAIHELDKMQSKTVWFFKTPFHTTGWEK